MKKILVIAVLLVAAFSVSAQEKVSFGVRGGLNLSDFVGSDVNNDGESKLGLNVGGAVYVPLTKSFYLESGLYLTSKGSVIKDEDWKSTATPLYLQIPLLASYHFNFTENLSLHLNTGPYLAYGVGGKIKDEYYGEEDSEDFFGDNGEFERKRFDAGLAIGVGMNVNKFYVGMQYERGFMKIVKDVKMYNSNFSVNFGYNF